MFFVTLLFGFTVASQNFWRRVVGVTENNRGQRFTRLCLFSVGETINNSVPLRLECNKLYPLNSFRDGLEDLAAAPLSRRRVLGHVSIDLPPHTTTP